MRRSFGSRRVQPSSRVLWQSQAAACSPAQRTSFFVVASCGLLPRTTRPGPRLRTAFWSVASPHPREVGVARALAVGATLVQVGADQVQDSQVQGFSTGPARRATRLLESVS